MTTPAYASPTMAMLIVLAGLMGAAGVALAAASAHAGTEARLDSAAYLLILHAVAVVAGVAALDRGLAWRPLGVAALAGFAVGSLLFAGDLSLRAFAGTRLFPMAAPTGGVLLIASWLALAAAAVIGMLRA
jgi:uncharacterized membrane protein YgdD (TMEM256/DUF423 family)